MKRRYSLGAVAALTLSVLSTACNDDSDTIESYTDPVVNSVMVNSFSLQKNDSIIANLDSVFFSIDLDNARIFNADSLPKNTRVSAMQVSIGLPSVSKAEITMPGKNGADTVVDYLLFPSDSINFTRGYVTLHLESLSGEVKRDYKIFVNVHKMDPDSLVWGPLSDMPLPSLFAVPSAQKTVEYQGSILCFTQSGNSYCVASTGDLFAGQWQKEPANLPAAADITSLTAGTEELYVTDDAGNLYSSADRGATWTATSTRMDHIYGFMAGKLQGVKKSGTKYFFVSHPASTEVEITEAECPVKGTSPAIIYTSDWSESPMMIVTGGINAAGNTVGATWAFDGTTWAQISAASVPAVESPVITPYFAFKTSTGWRVTKRSVLLLFGGRLADGTDNRTVYLSNDYGVHWAKAPVSMQMPPEVTIGKNAQAMVAIKQISRAITPITEWDCPYIYSFGGVNQADRLNPTVTRGVINRLMFKPLQ